MKKNFDEYAINIYVTNITKWSAYLEKQLSHGKKYLAGDKMTIADFAAAAIYFSYVHNDALAGGKIFTD